MTRSPRPVPSLRDYAISKVVASGDGEIWRIIGQWQRQGLVSVRPITKQSAAVELTQVGRKRISA